MLADNVRAFPPKPLSQILKPRQSGLKLSTKTSLLPLALLLSDTTSKNVSHLAHPDDTARHIIMKPSCKFYLAGKCQRGEYCRYRHSGKPIPSATAIKQVPSVPDFIPGTLTAFFEDGKKATFQDGLIPLHVDLAHDYGSSVRVISFQESLRVTWYKPSRSAWLRFESREMAASARDFLAKEVSFGEPASPNPQRETPSVVTLNKLGAHITKEKLLAALPADLKPRKVDFGKATYPPSTTTPGVVRRLIQKAARMEITAEDECEKSNPLKSASRYTFVPGVNLEAVVQQLDGFKVDLLGNTEIHAERHLDLNISLPSSSLSGKKQKLLQSVKSEAWRQHSVKIASQETETEGAEVHIYATSHDDLVKVKQQLFELFGGKQGFFTRANFGKVPKETHRIHLTKAKEYKLALKTIDSGKAEFGAEVLTLDDDSDPPTMVVQGDAVMLRRVQRHMKGDRAVAKSKMIACDICLDDAAEDWVKLAGCEHAACVDCVVGYSVTNPSEGTRQFPLKCFKDGCEVPLSLRQLRGFLSEEQLKGLLEQSLQGHIRQHPETFAQCPGKDCSKTYRKSDIDSDCQLCHNCLVKFCAHCGHKYHHGLSCEEHRKKVDEGDAGLQGWMEGAGAKRCPSCTLVVQKIDGCNHVECPTCSAHFCWLCLEVSDTSAGVYRHMTERHGGAYEDGGVNAAIARLIQDMDPAEAALNGVAGRRNGARGDGWADEARHPLGGMRDVRDDLRGFDNADARRLQGVLEGPEFLAPQALELLEDLGAG